MRYLKCSVFFLFIVLFSGCGETDKEKKLRIEREEKREAEIYRVYEQALLHSAEIIAKNCGSANQPECDGICLNQDILQNKEIKESCYVYCDFEPGGTTILEIIAEAMVKGAADGLSKAAGGEPHPDFCKKPEENL